MFEITLSGPGKNALGSEMMDFLLARLGEAGGQPVLLAGAGDAFCAGLNLKELAGLDAAGIERYLRKLEQVIEALYLYPGPTVAWVNGYAIAGGSVLALCCDHIVAADLPKSKIGLNEIAIGLRFPPVTLAMIRGRLGAQHENEVILGAQLFDPAGALRVGLVDELAADVAVAHARLATLASHPAPNYATAKRDLRGAAIAAARDEARFAAILPTWTSPEIAARIAGALKR